MSAPVPSVVSVSPSANSGTTQTFAFVFSDSQSSTNLSAAAMLFASSGAYPNSCFVIYDRNQGTVQLEWDNVNGNDAAAVGSPLTLQNSQCMVSATSVTTSALSTTITLTITFQNAFSGLKNIYMYGADGNGTINTGWVQMGTYAVTTVSAPVPSADSVVAKRKRWCCSKTSPLSSPTAKMPRIFPPPPCCSRPRWPIPTPVLSFMIATGERSSWSGTTSRALI